MQDRSIRNLGASPSDSLGGRRRIGLRATTSLLAFATLSQAVQARPPGERPGPVRSVARIQETPPPPTPPPVLVPNEAEANPPATDEGGPLPNALPDGFGSDAGRLPLIGEEPGFLGSTPKPSAEVLQKFQQFVERTIDPENTLDLIIGRPRVIVLKQVPVRYQLEEEQIARIIPLLENKQISVTGRQIGSTILNLWFGDPNDPEGQTVLSYLVRVLPDPEFRVRMERVYDHLAREINTLFPNSVVKLSMAGDKLVVSGEAKDVVEAAQILRIVAANAPGQGGGQARQNAAAAVASIPLANAGVANTMVDPVSGSLTTNSVGGLPTLANYQVAGGSNVINLLRVTGEQQVMLRVTVAEINRSAARAIGVDFSVLNGKGGTVFGNNTGRITNTLGSGGNGTGSGGSNSFRGNNNLIASLDNGRIFAAIAALRTLSFARTLASPNLTTTNGQPASFQAGGRFPVPIVTGSTLTGLQGVTFVPFGVQLSFTPYITDKDRIRLVVNSEVSVRDLLATTTVGNSSVPGLNTRNFQTTVELREGQTLAVAGLIQNSFGANASRVPLFGDLPIVGRLAAYDTNSYSEQELVVLITPELVHPYDPCQVPALPGSDVFEPGDLEFFLLGRLESRRPYDYRSTVRTGLDRMARYRHCDDIFIQGPHGHSEGR